MSTTTSTRHETAVRFLAALAGTAGRGELLELRYRLEDGQRMGQVFDRPDRLRGLATRALALGRRTDVYVGCAPRTRRHGGRDAVERAFVLWADCDGEDAVAALADFEPAPAILIASGTGSNCHIYWPLIEPAARDEVEHANRRLAYALGADRTVGTRQSSPNVLVVIYRSKSLPSLGDLERPVDGYIRVSRVGDRSGESYISPDVQRRSLESWAAERGIELVMHDPEENVSGATMDRPIFNRIMRRIRARESGGIVVYKLDRFARTLVGGLTTLSELTDHRALFASATEPLFDFTTADGRIFLQINLMMAEYFRERTREGWETSLTYAVGRGVHIAPDVPYGYDKDDDKRLVPDPSRAPFVLRAFELRAEGWPFQRIADRLNEQAPGRADGRPWTASSLERTIRRRVYRGIAHWGEHENRRAHPALVPEPLWHAAQGRAHHYSPSSAANRRVRGGGLVRSEC